VPTFSTLQMTLGAVALGASLMACGPRRGVLSRDEHRAAALVGAWDAEFRVTTPLVGRQVGEAVSGMLVLIPNSHLGPAANGMLVPTHYGAYEVDFRAFGFDPRPSGEVPTVMAALMAEDSVLIVLGPTSSHGQFVVSGRLEDGSVRGTWRYDLRIGAAAGEVILRRTGPQP
jgi:hypothetical protein